MKKRSTPEDYRITATALSFAVRMISDIVAQSPALDLSKKAEKPREEIGQAQAILLSVIGDLRIMSEELDAAKKSRAKKLKANREAKRALGI